MYQNQQTFRKKPKIILYLNPRENSNCIFTGFFYDEIAIAARKHMNLHTKFIKKEIDYKRVADGKLTYYFIRELLPFNMYALSQRVVLNLFY